LAEAKRIADETISRLRLVQKEFPDSQKQTMMSALNNRAVIAIRERKADEAVRYLIDAAAQFEDVPFVVYHNSTLLLEVSSIPKTILDLDRSSRSKLVQLLARKKPESPGAAIPQRYLYSLAHDAFNYVTAADKPVAGLPEPKSRETELAPIAAGYQLSSSGSGFLIAPGIVLTNRHVVVSERLKGASDGRFKRGQFDRKGMGHSDSWILRSPSIGVCPWYVGWICTKRRESSICFRQGCPSERSLGRSESTVNR
jgi:hypothetical protein